MYWHEGSLINQKQAFEIRGENMKTNYKKAYGFGFVLLALLLFFALGSENKISAADTGTVTVYYLDQYNNNLKAPEVLEEEVGTAYTIPITQIDGYNLGLLPGNRTGTFTLEPITVIFNYSRNEASVTSFGSLHFSALASEAFYNGGIGDYDGNVAFFKDLSNEALTNAMVRRITTSITSGTMMSSFVYIPTGSGQYLTAFPDFKIYSGDSVASPNFPNDNSLLLTPQRIADAGYILNVMYSTDGGTTFRFQEDISDIKAVNVVEYQFIRTRAAAANPLIVDGANPLWIRNDSPVAFDDSLLTPEQLSGADPMSGWQFKLRNVGGIVNSPVKLYNVLPGINGTVRLNETAVDWATGTGVENIKVKLIDSDGDTLATTQTDASGNFVFDSVDSDKQLSVVIDEATDVYFFDPTTDLPSQLTDNTVLVGNTLEIGKAFDTKTINWKSTVATNPNALNAKDGRFLINEVPAQIAGPVIVYYVDENGTALALPVTLTGQIGEPFETQALDIPGYTLVQVPINSSGTFTEEEQLVIYIYASNGENPGPIPDDGHNGITDGNVAGDILPRTGGGLASGLAVVTLAIGLGFIVLNIRKINR